MTAYSLGVFAYLADNRVGVLLKQCGSLGVGDAAVRAEILVVGHSGRVELLGFEGIALYGILVGEALGAGELVHAAVGAGIHHIVLNVDGLAVCGLYHCHGVVAVGK